MGNVTDKAPQNYDENQVHEGDFLQSYKGGGAEQVPLTGSAQTLSIGAKIIQSVSGHQDTMGNWIKCDTILNL